MEDIMKRVTAIILTLLLSLTIGCSENSSSTSYEDSGVSDYSIVGTDQTKFYDNESEISKPSVNDPFYGQDGNYIKNSPTYQDNGDGTITDLITGLMWQKTSDQNGDGVINYDDKMSQSEAVAGAESFDLGGYDDWRLPTIKELYSLILFSGADVSGYNGGTDDLIPFIDTDYFEFGYGDTEAGERIIDAQFTTTSIYTGTTMNDPETMFGVNFADGRIKGYPTGPMPGQSEDKQFYVMYVRGNSSYGTNQFSDNGDGTITDSATGLMWKQIDSGVGMNWEEALSYAEGAEFAGYSDWRLADVKELQSIVDYTRSPEATNSPAIDPLFSCTAITNEAGETDYPSYWSSTTHANWSEMSGAFGAYISFGKAMGNMFGDWIDVHGAGAQRSDPKAGDASQYPYGNGPQGDAVRINNFVRLVRDIN